MPSGVAGDSALPVARGLRKTRSRIYGMNLPNIAAAIISPEKLRDYLLSPIHPVGRYKAAFFESQGYSQAGWEILADDLRLLLAENADPLHSTEYGTKYVIRGWVTGPKGCVFGIVTVGIILRGEEVPRFVTAFPRN